jgi:hypothetical protein
MIPKIIFAIFLIGCLFPLMAAAIAPPKVIAERNLEAKVIAVGEVVGVKVDETRPHFVLRIEHIMKGFGLVNKDDQISVLFRPPPPKNTKIAYHVQGILPVKVKVGYLVVVYLERSHSHPWFFKPILEGLSVITIGSPLPVKNE